MSINLSEFATNFMYDAHERFLVQPLGNSLVSLGQVINYNERKPHGHFFPNFHVQDLFGDAGHPIPDVDRIFAKTEFSYIGDSFFAYEDSLSIDFGADISAEAGAVEADGEIGVKFTFKKDLGFLLIVQEEKQISYKNPQLIASKINEFGLKNKFKPRNHIFMITGYSTAKKVYMFKSEQKGSELLFKAKTDVKSDLTDMVDGDEKAEFSFDTGLSFSRKSSGITEQINDQGDAATFVVYQKYRNRRGGFFKPVKG